MNQLPGPKLKPAGSLRALSPLLLLLAARLALGLAYSQVVPAWESYDEDGHFAYASYLARHHTLILQPTDPEASQIWEKFQPPLYYDLVAPVIALFNPSSNFQGPPRNPYLAAGDAGVNYALHGQVSTPAERSAEGALGAGRALSVLISTLSVVPAFLAARRLWPREPRTVWLATTLYAFWPQFLFVGSMLTNDVLITALSAAAVWAAVELVLDGFRLRWALLLSALAGLGLITKLNGAVLIVLAGGALALSLAAGAAARPDRRPARLVVGLFGLAALVAGALWLLGSLDFVTRQVFQISVARDFVSNLSAGGPLTGSFALAALAYAFRTFLASYGWGNLETFSWLYGLWALGALLAAAGLGVAIWRRQRDKNQGGPPARIYLLLSLYGLAAIGLALALAIAQRSVYLVPGRYLLPALPAVVLLLAGGWRAWLPQGTQRFACQAVSLGLVLVGWAVPFRILAPAYARPGPDRTGKVDTPIAVVFGDRLELLGYNGAVQAVAGESLQATLCWQATRPIASDDTLFLEVVGADGQGYGRLRTYPGRGNYPTSQWAPNTTFCERYQVPLGQAIPAPALAHLRIAWLAGSPANPLPIRQASGEQLADSAYSVEFKVAGRPGWSPPIAHPTEFRLGQQIRLSGYETAAEAGRVRVTLRWEALADVSDSYVAFVHLRDTPAHAYAQQDGLPVQGAYPTRLWKKGEIILDPHVLELPAGRTPPLDLIVGMYDAGTHQRLAVFDTSGQEVQSDEILLASGLVFP